MLNKIYIFAFFASIILFYSSCNDDTRYKKVDVSQFQSDIKVIEFYKEFHQINTANFELQNQLLKTKYDPFYTDFIYGIMQFYRGQKDTTDKAKPIVTFTQNDAIRGLYDSVVFHYPSLNFLKKDLDGLNKHLQHYFPSRKITKVYAIIGEFSYGAMTYDDSTLAVGLDMYLGPQYPFYKSFDIPDYLTRKLKSEYIVPNCAEVLYNLYRPENVNPGTPLIEAMVEEGKKLYFMECMLPEKHDSLIIGYTNTQLQWCKASEKQIWKFMNEKDLLYTTNLMEQKRYIGDGPTTSGMPPESPGKVGAWVGWQIVRKYMRENGPQASLSKLLYDTDAKTIIAKAKYKP